VEAGVKEEVQEAMDLVVVVRVVVVVLDGTEMEQQDIMVILDKCFQMEV
jgi:hypothetical protein